MEKEIQKEGETMFIKQIDTEEALRLASQGTEIKILMPGEPESGWKELRPDTLQEMLEGCLFFRDEDAVENPELEKAVKQPLPAAKKKPKKVVDRGKVVALHRAGRSNKWIADDMGLHISTVNRVIRELKEEGKLNETTDAKG